jgi:hypothetical protein
MNAREAVILGNVRPSDLAGWEILLRTQDGYALRKGSKIRAIISAAFELDGRKWVHLSISRPDRLPTWEELRKAKDELLGDVEAYMVIPPRARYVNLHPHVLHLFTCATAPAGVLSAFERGGASL